LPVRDVARSKEFFAKLGFEFHPRHAGEDNVAGLSFKNGFLVMLFPEETFKGFTRNEIAETSRGTEVLLSIDAQSREEVDELVRIAEEAGGEIYGRPSDHGGWMYGAGFADLDGHRWNILYMDAENMPK